MWTMDSMNPDDWEYRLNLQPRKPLNPLCCSCSHCNYVLTNTAQWTEVQKHPLRVSIKVGDRVLVQGCHTGVVKYVGDLDSEYTNDQIFVGVKLDDPVGKNDGLYQGKRFFQCPNYHGIIVPIEHVHLLAPREGYKQMRTKPNTTHEEAPFDLDMPYGKPEPAVGQVGQTRQCIACKYQEFSTTDWSSELDEPAAAESVKSRKINLPELSKHSKPPKYISAPDLHSKTRPGAPRIPKTRSTATRLAGLRSQASSKHNLRLLHKHTAITSHLASASQAYGINIKTGRTVTTGIGSATHVSSKHRSVSPPPDHTHTSGPKSPIVAYRSDLSTSSGRHRSKSPLTTLGGMNVYCSNLLKGTRSRSHRSSSPGLATPRSDYSNKTGQHRSRSIVAYRSDLSATSGRRRLRSPDPIVPYSSDLSTKGGQHRSRSIVASCSDLTPRSGKHNLRSLGIVAYRSDSSTRSGQHRSRSPIATPHSDLSRSRSPGIATPHSDSGIKIVQHRSSSLGIPSYHSNLSTRSGQHGSGSPGIATTSYHSDLSPRGGQHLSRSPGTVSGSQGRSREHVSPSPHRYPKVYQSSVSTSTTGLGGFWAAGSSTVRSQPLSQSEKEALEAPLDYQYGGDISDTLLDMEDSQQLDKEYQEMDKKWEDNYSKDLMSGLSAKDTETPPPKYSAEVDTMKELKEMVDKWGGGEKGFHMALTLQKLQAASQKGKKELQWQKELLEMDQDNEFAARKRVIDCLKEKVFESRRKTAFVDSKIQKLQLLMDRPPENKEITELKLRIQKLEKKNSNTLRELYCHPIGNIELVKHTIARITEDYRERRKNIEQTGAGHALLQYP